MAEKPQKNGKESCKKYWLTTNERVLKTGRILRENGRQEIFVKK